MGAVPPAINSDDALKSSCLQKTVAVADMVGYSDVARMLEENISSLSVAELNRQVQSFMTQSLSALSDPASFRVIATPGDGIIVLFDSADDAHSFGYQVQVLAREHNRRRTQTTAERWFRVGIATGEVTITDCDDLLPQYAGAVIATAVRLESAANPAEIVIDASTFALLSNRLQLLYDHECIVRGKRKETFRAHRLRVAKPNPSGASRLLTRRAFFCFSAIAAASAGISIWMESPLLYLWLHPLPAKRFVALWVESAAGLDPSPVLSSVIDAIHSRLIRSEAYVHDFVVVGRQEMANAEGTSPAPGDGLRTPQEIANTWGANLVLAVSLVIEDTFSALELRLMDQTVGRAIRRIRLKIGPNDQGGLYRAASTSAARILDLPAREHELSDDAELASTPASARNLFAEAKLMASQPNDAKIPEAIDKYEAAITASPRFALAYAELGHLYLGRFSTSHDLAELKVADQHLTLALELNPNSERAQLGHARFLLASGHADASLPWLTRILQADPSNMDALFYKAKGFRQLRRPHEEEQVYREIIRVRPSYWHGYNELGVLLQARARYDEATECFKTAAIIAPRLAIPLTNLGTLYLEQGRLEDAREAFQRAIELAPNETAYENLGTLAYKRRDYQSARDFYLRAQQLAPNDYFILTDLGDAYSKLGFPEKVLECYTKAARILSGQLDLNPNDGPSWMTLAFYHAKIGDNAAARSDISQAGLHGASDVASIFTHARALALLGEHEKAKNLVAVCMSQGFSQADVELAPELAFLLPGPSHTRQ
jgi:tetratricopeptide (TPR) repeat protein/class 3 adenylate cyclase